MCLLNGANKVEEAVLRLTFGLACTDRILTSNKLSFHSFLHSFIAITSKPYRSSAGICVLYSIKHLENNAEPASGAPSAVGFCTLW